VTTVPGSVVGSLYGAAAEVNSLHHQILATLAPSLRATALADDDVVEAVELPGAPVIAVQWHPEMLDQPDPVFAWLLDQAAAYAAARRAR
jgi:putative glutamine amidotransferase